ncbi:hypothetical protein ACHAQJ_010439 [Trichoderma viride]
MSRRLSRHEGRSPLPSMQSEISILNAEKYGEEPRRSRHSRSDEIIVNSKRSPSLEHDDDDDAIQKKRSRGRPRLDTKDETAADRRRTQIRLAQRAYRHRKDTAITTLEQKVKDLEASNEAMSKEFTKFYDIILAEGIFDIAPHAAPRLRLIADRLLRISSMVGSSSMTSPESEDSIMAKPTAARKGPNDVSMHHGPQTSGMGEPDLTSSVYSTAQHHPGSFNYEVIAQATPNNASFPFFASIESTSSQPTGSYLGNSMTSPSPYPRLSPPTSFGFHERSFSRRLQKTTLEGGLKLATMKNPPPEQYATVFGFCLLFESRDSIIRRLAAGLKKVQSESLDWKLPASSVQNDQFGYLESQFSSVSSDDLNQALLSLGKSASGFSNLSQSGSQSQMSSDDRTEQRIRMICQNFEGEFFTADEVELFLRRLGLAIPPNADYVESELDLNELQAADEASTKSHFASIGVSPSNSGINGFQNNMWNMNASSMGDFGSSLRGDPEGQHMKITEFVNESNLSGGLVSFMNSHDFGQLWPTGSSWPKTKVSIDVTKLIDELVSRSVCLGRTPGIRPKDVVKSVKIAAGLSPSNAP